MRVVIDANVLISCLICPEGRTGRIRDLMREGRFTVLYSREPLAEFINVISRPHLIEKYRVQEQDIHAFRSLILMRGKRIEIKTRVNVCRDPKDNVYLSLALDGHADYIVSGDGDLLSLSPFRGIAIIKPAKFLDILAK
ncbi:MAG: putative toxin-antitoxin system toxin component, PIN family [Anaerolineales bacterium]|nr:putative toxin-antitoxin system toxin component, PIN family [Anaerolineales bacterium]